MRRTPTTTAGEPTRGVPLRGSGVAVGPDTGPGTDIDGYRVVSTLGQGGMGLVLLARDEHLDRDVALKLIHPDVAADGRVRARFRDEARAMARVRHANVATIHSFGEWRDLPYLVMEYVGGGSLERVLIRRRGSGLSFDAAFDVLDQLCRGVAAIHATGTTHGDLKPGNVLIRRGHEVVIADFGLARRDGQLEPAGQVSGTPGYMAPEVAMDLVAGPTLAPRADVYSLGVIAYELLTGRLPFEAEKSEELMMMHICRTAPRASSLCRGLPPMLDGVLAAALTKSAEARVGSAEQLRGLLARARAAMSVRRSAAAIRVLVADPDKTFRDAVTRSLAHELPGAAVEGVSDGRDALAAFERHWPALAIIAQDLSGGDAISLTAALRAQATALELPILISTSHCSALEWQALAEAGAQACLLKAIGTGLFATMAARMVPRSRTPGG